MKERIRYNLYLSDVVWAELRRHVILQPGQDASRVTEYVLRAWLEAPVPLAMQVRGEWESPARRSVYLTPDTWQRVKDQAEAQGISISRLTETLLRNYLGIAEKP